MHDKQGQIADQADRVPALLARFVNPVLKHDVILVAEDLDCCLEVDAMLEQVDAIFFFVPFEAHRVIQAYHACADV